MGTARICLVTDGTRCRVLDALNIAAIFGGEDADILFNVGKTMIDAGQAETGLMQMEKSFLLSPSLSLAENLGDIYYAQSNYAKSCFYYLKVYQESQSNSALLRRLAFALFQCGETSQAFSLMVTLVNRAPDNSDYAVTCSDIARGYAPPHFNEEIKKAIGTCLSKKNIRYVNFRTSWSGIFLLDPAYQDFRNFCTSISIAPRSFPDVRIQDFNSLFTDRFFINGLQKIHLSSIPLEHLLTNIRCYFLAHWKNYELWPKEILDFLAALSCQIQMSDYVYFETSDDKSDLKELIAFLGEQCTPDEPVSDSLATLIALGSCFKPLYDIFDPSSLPVFSKYAAQSLRPVLEEQFYNPLTEKEIRATLQSVTHIEDATSKAVQDMYETRPYPRWSSASLGNTTDHVREISRDLDILVAGCGTGQEPALLINRMPECHITAIDLSRTSLSYAVRKAKELGYINHVDFFHGDLMNVSRLDRDFDFVVSSGVLHHLKDPDKGLSAILHCLRPQGLLSLSLYSKIARDYKLDPAATYIRDKGYSSSVDDIRQFRRDLFSKQIGDPVLLCAETFDFFNLSECNDMLFHVQEHRYTLSDIEALAARHGMEIIDIFLSPTTQKSFQTLYPGASKLDFSLLDEYERQHPDSFMEMYRIYMKRKGAPVQPRLLDLLKLGAL